MRHIRQLIHITLLAFICGIRIASSQAFANPQGGTIAAGGMLLNRINPSQGVSAIDGRLTATGLIILINPAGIFFGPSAPGGEAIQVLTKMITKSISRKINNRTDCVSTYLR